MIATPASLRSGFIHIVGMAIYITSRRKVPITSPEYALSLSAKAHAFMLPLPHRRQGVRSISCFLVFRCVFGSLRRSWPHPLPRLPISVNLLPRVNGSGSSGLPASNSPMRRHPVLKSCVDTRWLGHGNFEEPFVGLIVRLAGATASRCRWKQATND